MSEPIASLEKPLSPAAQRMRPARERRADGLKLIKFWIYTSQIDTAVARRLLPSDFRNDPEEIAYALYTIVDRVLPPPL